MMEDREYGNDGMVGGGISAVVGVSGRLVAAELLDAHEAVD